MVWWLELCILIHWSFWNTAIILYVRYMCNFPTHPVHISCTFHMKVPPGKCFRNPSWSVNWIVAYCQKAASHDLNQYWPCPRIPCHHIWQYRKVKLCIVAISFILTFIFLRTNQQGNMGEGCSSTQIARFMGPTWDPPGSCRPQMGPMNLAIRERFSQQLKCLRLFTSYKPHTVSCRCQQGQGVKSSSLIHNGVTSHDVSMPSTHWPLGDLEDILFKQIEADFRDWWLGYLWWSCP